MVTISQIRGTGGEFAERPPPNGSESLCVLRSVYLSARPTPPMSVSCAKQRGIYIVYSGIALIALLIQSGLLLHRRRP